MSRTLQAPPTVFVPQVLGLTRVASVGTAGVTGGHDVCLNGDYAYVPSYVGDALVIINISDPENPVITATLTDVGHSPFDRLDGVHDIVYHNGYVYMTKMIDNDGIVVVDVHDPENPFIADMLHDDAKFSSTHALSLSADGNHVYAGGYQTNAGYFCIVNITDPTNIFIEGYIDDDATAGYRTSVEIGNLLLVHQSHGDEPGIVTLDISDKSNPVVLGKTTGIGGSLMYDSESGYLYANKTVGDYPTLNIVNIDNAPTLVCEKTVTLPIFGTSVNYSTINGTEAYVTVVDFGTATGGIGVVDIREPSIAETACVVAETKGEIDFAAGVKTSGDYVFVSPRDQADTQLVVYRKSRYPLQTSRSLLISATRDMTAASGDVYYECGFKPTSAHMMITITDTAESVGKADNILYERCVYTGGTRTSWCGTYLCMLFVAGGYQHAVVKSYDDEGITLTWTKYGSPTGTAYGRIALYR